MALKKYLSGCLILIFCFISIGVHGQIATALKAFGSANDDIPLELVTDAEGNFYLTGHIGKGSGVISFENIPGSKEGSFIAKLDRSQRIIWLKNFDNDAAIHDYTDLAVDSQGDILVTGQKDSGNGWYFFLYKLDHNGNLKWKNEFRRERYNFSAGRSLAIDKHNNVYVAGNYEGEDFEGIPFPLDVPNEDSPERDLLVKFSPEGAIVWAKSSPNFNLKNIDVALDSEGNIITFGGFSGKAYIDGLELENTVELSRLMFASYLFLSKRDPSGKALWAKALPFHLVNDYNHILAIDNKNDIYFTTESSTLLFPEVINIDSVQLKTSDIASTTLVKISSLGKAIWGTRFPGFPVGTNTRKVNGPSELIYANNALYLAGYFAGGMKVDQDSLISLQGFSTFLAKIDLSGKRMWLAKNSSSGKPNIAYELNEKKIFLTGKFQDSLKMDNKVVISNGGKDIYFAQIADTSSTLIARISGKVYEDKTPNCDFDISEKGLANSLIKVEPGGHYALTNNLGEYSLKLEAGSYQITPIFSDNSKSRITRFCNPVLIAETDSSHTEVKQLNFGYEILPCPLLTVDIAADRRRRCFRSKTTVTYTNEGTADAQNVKIKVLYPKYVVPIKSSLAWAARQDSVLLFDIGTLKAGERRSFVITDSTICGNESIRGLSQCVKVIITPRNTCLSPSPDWDQSSVAVEAQLTDEDQTASFTIANEGQGDMSDSTAYRVFANEALVEEGKVKLSKGEKATLQVPMAAATLRLEADQSVNHPGRSRPTASVQPPVVGPSMAAPTPVDAFFQDDADAEVSISCLNIIDSFDPNDKQVTPQGITRRHYIKAEDELQYQIRFQNTGTDTAYTVVVKDTLSEFVDVASLRIGSASHPFTYSVSGKGRPVLTFTFKKINLPDHKTNEPASHGYIRFSVSQSPDNPKGTVIRNVAYNYFDYNSPIATNQVFNIIGDTIIAPLVPVAVYDCGKAMPTLAQAGADVHLCEASQTVLQANTPVQGLGRWHMLSGQATLSDPSDPQATLSGIGYGEVVLEWRISLCERVSSSQVKVMRYAIPAAPTLAAPPLQCQGSQLMPLTATGSNIIWYADAEQQQKLHEGNSYTPQVNVTTTLYATQTVNGCQSPAAAVEVPIHPASVNFEVAGDTLVAPVADSYQWFFHGQQIEGATSQKYLARNTGAYTLQTITRGCTSVSSPVAHTVHVAQATLKLHPNPAAGQIKLELAANETGEVSLFIWDRLGRKVGAFRGRKEWTVLEQSLELDKLSPGLYLLEVRLGKQALTRKFVKQ